MYFISLLMHESNLSDKLCGEARLGAREGVYLQGLAFSISTLVNV
jgi:hypothetical protein